MTEPCPFCQYAKASDPTLPVKVNGRTIYPDRSRPVLYFEPLNPVTPGHMLFVPTWHSVHRDSVAASAAFRSAYDYATTGDRYDTDFNLIVSSGPTATQTIEHLHVHYVPRYNGDDLDLPWTGPRR